MPQGIPKPHLVAMVLAALVAIAWSGVAQAQLPGAQRPSYQDPGQPAERRAADLVGRMTLEEKAFQLLNDAPAIPRLSIREYNWWNEGLHGVAAAGNATVFPQAIGLAATFDEALVGQVADLIGIEFRAKHLAARHRFGGSDWFEGLTVWSPNINIFRDPRWGRGQETYGEDPYLTSRLGVAFIRGLQGDDPEYLLTVATPKHFAVHSGPEASRHRDNIAPSAHDLADTYLPAFRAAIMEGGAQSLMCAYNAVDGVPACANDRLMTYYLRDVWGFEGFVVSDCGAVSDIHGADRHAYVATPEQAVAAAFNAGMDLICGGPEDGDAIVRAVRRGTMPEAVIDRSLVRLFTARMKLGQFDEPSRVFPAITAADFDTPEGRALAQTTAEKGIVLLKNDGLLPLGDTPGRIAVIGPNADSLAALVGNYNGDPSQPVTVLDGIRRRWPQAQVTYVEGAGLIDRALEPPPRDVLCVDAYCRSPGVMIERFRERDLAGTAAATDQVDTVAHAWSGALENGAIRYTAFLKAPETGDYVFRYDANGGYRIVIDDMTVVDAWNIDWRPSISAGTVRLQQGQTYRLRVEAFQRATEGNEQLLWSPPSDPGAERAEAAARDADLVVFVGGLTSQLEGEELPLSTPGFAGGDRTSLDLPQSQQRLLERLHATGTPVVLVLVNGSALSVNWADRKLPAILEAWYPGGQGGDAVARILAGDVNPSGRLPVTFYRSAEDLPPFTDYDMRGRTYRYFDGPVLYPFGHGLSYTRFHYSEMQLSDSTVAPGEPVRVSAIVTNIGERQGDEVVQLYVQRPGVEGAPLRALAGAQRLSLVPGERRRVGFTLDARSLSTLDEGGVRRLVRGRAVLWVGGGQPGSAAPGRSATLTVTMDAVMQE